MLYEVVIARIREDGSVTEEKRKQLYQCRAPLEVGGLYFLRSGKLYRVLEEINTEGSDGNA